MLLQPLELAINRYLALDPESPKRLQSLQGKVVTIEMKALSVCFQLIFHEDRIQLSPDETLEAEIKIRGTPVNLFALALARDKKQAFFKDGVTLEGNAELGQQIVDLFNELEIDWEEQLSHLVGDLPANRIGRLTRSFLNWGKEARSSLTQNLNEYVHEEKPWFPPKEALQDFFRDVDELRLDLDRLEARSKLLQDGS